MPRHVMRHRSRRSRMHGAGILDWLRKAHDFVKKHKLVSRIGGTLSGLHPAIGHVARGAALLGYGRRHHRMHRGGALRLAGGALRPPYGSGRRRHRRRM